MQYKFYQKHFHTFNNYKVKKKYKIHYFVEFDNSSVKIRLIKIPNKEKMKLFCKNMISKQMYTNS